MRALTDREQRTIRLAAGFLAIYLACFFGLRVWKQLEAKRTEYQQLQLDAQRLRRDILVGENKALLTQKLKDSFHIDFMKLSRTTLVAEASAAIQRAAQGGGVQIGPVRESPARASAKELASMQLEAMGPVPALMSFLHRLEGLGYPLIIDSVQLGAETGRPGMAAGAAGPGVPMGPGGPGGPGGPALKMSLSIVILDYEAWKKQEVPHA